MKYLVRVCGLPALLYAGVTQPASAQETADPIQLGAEYIVDAVGVAAGPERRIQLLDNLNVTADFDIDRLAGWNGASGHIHILNNNGAMPNTRAGTLQGIDNIEVGSQRLRLFEAWIEQRIDAATSVRAGLYDLNSEFYSNDAAGLLIAPAFGVGSEIAATGPNGPSIFPSSALAIRLDRKIGENGYARFAMLNANAGTLGDAQGVNTTFDDGALLIAQGGVGTVVKLVAGGWAYTRRQDDIYRTDMRGDPERRAAYGGYFAAEAALNDPDGARAVSVFARAGVSDGQTTPFRGGWQAGMIVAKLFATREDSAVSIGANQGYLSTGYRAVMRDAGQRPAAAETAFEVTYSDRIAPHVTIQPDAQLILDPGGDRDRRALFVAALRLSVSL